MNRLALRHWPHVSFVFLLKNVTCSAREPHVAQSCRYMSKKVIIRWPKGLPSPGQPQNPRTKLANNKRNKERHLHKSSPVVKSFDQCSGTSKLSDEVMGQNEDEEFENEVTSDWEENTDIDEFENSEQAVPLHFSETGVGMSGTFIVKGRNTDRVLEDLTTSQLININDESNIVGHDEVHLSDDGPMDFGEKLGDENTRVASSPSENNFEYAKKSFDKRFQRIKQPLENGFDEEKQSSFQRGDISSNEEKDGDDSGSLGDEVTYQNSLKRKSEPWREIPSLKRQNQPKQKQRHKKVYIDSKNEVLFGISPCHLALLQNRRHIVNAFVLEAFEVSARSEAQEIIKMLCGKGVNVHVKSRRELNRLSQDRPHQGVCLEVSCLNFENLANISGELMTADMDSRVCLLALDKIMDPMNLGALMRSAYFLGVDTMVANKQNCCPLTPIVSKASSGICEVMPIYSVVDMVTFLGDLADYGWHIIGATNKPDTGQGDSEKLTSSCTDVKLSKPTVLVIGSEGFGLRRSIQSLCQTFVTVPPGRTLHPGIDSLNVSVATGILLHSLLVQR